jgi:hypothetical protein
LQWFTANHWYILFFSKKSCYPVLLCEVAKTLLRYEARVKTFFGCGLRPLWETEHNAMLIIKGIGWLNAREHGRIRKGLRLEYASRDGAAALWQQEKALFREPAKNFGRFDSVTRWTYYAVGLALDDAGLAGGGREDVGLLATNDGGCLAADIEYFKDYVACGRTLARGNLFIYTLPSSPAAEAAIAFGLQGPLLYVTSLAQPLTAALEMAATLLRYGETQAMLVVQTDARGALCLALTGESTDAVCSLEQALAIIRAGEDREELVAALERRRGAR